MSTTTETLVDASHVIHTESASGYYEIDPSTYNDTNPFVSLVTNQKIVNVPEFVLESGYKLTNIPIAYKTWGRLNTKRDNVIIICHALTGSSDVSDWWGPLLGKTNKAFDYSKYFIICLNSMGSPYGSFSPLSINSATGYNYGPEFPLCTVRDDVRIHKQILTEYLHVNSVACVIGGSMGGMLTLEYANTFGPEFVRNFVALATSARHSAWCISWSEAQRQAIYSDPKYKNGFYDLNDPPTTGLSAARMSALLTYRSRNSFEKRFARGNETRKTVTKENPPTTTVTNTSFSNDTSDGTKTEKFYKDKVSTITLQNLKIHNDGHKPHPAHSRSIERKNSSSSISSSNSSSTTISHTTHTALHTKKDTKPPQTFFSAQSYLRYQGEKFVSRFDANCYISITRKLDTHDLQRGHDDCESLEEVLQKIEQPNLIIGIESDGLFTYSEQEFLAENLPNSTLYKIDSMEGHDAFLLEFREMNTLIQTFLADNCPVDPETLISVSEKDEEGYEEELEEGQGKPSLFGEAEEVTNW